MCFTWGVDPSSLGNTIGFAIDNLRAGKIKLSRKIDYGDFESIYEFAKEIRNRNGEGFNFSDGVRISAKKIGNIDSAVEIKGLEPIGLDPRGLKITGLSMGVCSFGGSYNNSNIHFEDIYSGPDRNIISNKHKKLFDNENKINLTNCLLICPLIGSLLEWDAFERILLTVLGISYPKRTLQTSSNKITTLIRHFNLREGLGEIDDFLPKKLYEQPLLVGGSQGQTIDIGEYKEELKAYYSIRGYNPFGVPYKKSDLDPEEITYYF